MLEIKDAAGVTRKVKTTVDANGEHSPFNTAKEIGQNVWCAGFSQVGVSVLDPLLTSPVVSGGISYSQASGSLSIVASGNANAEFLTRSLACFSGSMRIRASHILSQRIAGNNFAIMLADLIGEGLNYTIVSATQVNVVVPNHGWTSSMVGQFVNLAGITGGTDRVPGRYAVAAIIDINTIQFTVSGWPASGTGTLTLFGRNYARMLFNGTVATNVGVDTQRNGWAAGDTTATINTTASPGTIVAAELTGRDAFFSDQLRASSPTPNFTTRASRYENIPDDDVELYVWIWVFNGSSAPASQTTWTLGHVSVEEFANMPVYLQGVRANGGQNALPVSLIGTTNVVQGASAHDSLIFSNPLLMAGDARTANPAAVSTPGDVARLLATMIGALVTKPHALHEAAWAQTVTVTATTDTLLIAAAAAGLRRHIVGMHVHNTGGAVATLNIRDGTTTRVSPSFPAGASEQLVLEDMITVSAATALNLSLGAAGSVTVTAWGYTAP